MSVDEVRDLFDTWTSTYISEDGVTALCLINASTPGHHQLSYGDEVATHVHIPSMTFWQAELLMNRFAFPRIAISMAFPTCSSRSSSLSSLA